MRSLTEKEIMIMEEEEEEYSEFAFKLVTSSVLPMVLKTAIELDLLEIMAEMAGGPNGASEFTAAEISDRLPTENPDATSMVERILRVLATHSLLTCTYSPTADGDGKIQRRYGLGPACRFLLKNEDGVSFSPLHLMLQDKVYMESWYYVKDAVLLGGVPFTRAYGINCFEYHGTDPRFNRLFNDAMNNLSTMVMTKILQSYNGFEGLGSLVDVGGGTGAISRLIATKYPEIKAINFDLPHVIQEAQQLKGVEHVGGDMFKGVPKADAIFMKWILHDWGDELCLKLLENCFQALPEDGKVIVVEMLMPDQRTVISRTAGSTVSACVDALMLALNNGGKERTKEEFESLARAAGFLAIKPVCCAFSFWVMEFHKKMAD